MKLAIRRLFITTIQGVILLVLAAVLAGYYLGTGFATVWTALGCGVVAAISFCLVHGLYREVLNCCDLLDQAMELLDDAVELLDECQKQPETTEGGDDD